MILLITCFPWDSGQGGACILRHWVEKLDREPIYWFALSQPAGQIVLSAAHVKCEFKAPPARGNVRFKLKKFWGWYKRHIWSRATAHILRRRIDELKPRVIWLMADYGLAPVAVRLLPTLLGKRIHISVHDHPFDTAKRDGLSDSDLKNVVTFQNSWAELRPTMDGISAELLDSLISATLQRSIIALPVKSEETASEIVGVRTDGLIYVGLSGNYYSHAELNSFLVGLQVWCNLRGRDWKLVVFGRKPQGDFNERIEFHNFRPIAEVRKELKRCDFLLLPLPVDAESTQMQTSVPTKLTTYIEAGRLVFAFAPSGSATERIISESNLGPVLTRLDTELVVEQLDRLATWDIAAANKGRQKLLEDRFNEKRMLSDLSCLLS